VAAARPVENIRRLQGLAVATEALVFAVRTPAAANDASAAPLRLSMEPAPGGLVRVQILKRRCPVATAPLLLSLRRPAYFDELRTANAGQPAQLRSPIVSVPQAPAIGAGCEREKAGRACCLSLRRRRHIENRQTDN
jgi:protein ImuA